MTFSKPFCLAANKAVMFKIGCIKHSVKGKCLGHLNFYVKLNVINSMDTREIDGIDREAHIYKYTAL